MVDIQKATAREDVDLVDVVAMVGEVVVIVRYLASMMMRRQTWLVRLNVDERTRRRERRGS